MSDVLLDRDGRPAPALPGEPSVPRPNRRRSWIIALLHWFARLATLALIVAAVAFEARTSYFQSYVVARLTAGASFATASGPSDTVVFPAGGPYDERLGYAQIPAYLSSLETRGFMIERQARLSPRLAQLSLLGGYPIFNEKPHAGLALLDRDGVPIYAASYPEREFTGFDVIPPLLVDSLLFVEDHDLLDPQSPHRNPAIDWQRFPLAVAGQAASLVDPRYKEGGASTLATQIEKFRHWPGGRTGTAEDKLRQMAVATARAYMDGPDTRAARQRVVTIYLNSTPLGSRPGYGEVIGVSDGLWAWYGTDPAEAARILASPALDQAQLARKAEVYKQALSLVLAERRPSYYLSTDRLALGTLTDRYLRLLAGAGVIDPALAEAALKNGLDFAPQPPSSPPVSFVGRKAADALRAELLSLLRIPTTYGLDRLDLTAESTLDAAVQGRVAAFLARLSDPAQVKALGLMGKNLLGSEDPARITYSVVLYERGEDRNYLRVHADSRDEPFDVNSGAKLILGSTAKLRTLATYLNIVTALHDRMAILHREELQVEAESARDPLTRWAATYLGETSDRRLQPMLDAAMQRRYSANPNEVFFTGGGEHVFHNFEKYEDYQTPTVEEAFENSVNLAFVRLMRDVTRYYTAQSQDRARELLADRHAPEREIYLRRFADLEGQDFLNRFYDDYRGRTPDEALAQLASHARPAPRRLAVLFRTVRPDANPADLRAFIHRRLPGLALSPAATRSLYDVYGPERFTLADRGFLAGVHPLELWLVAYLQDHPQATRTDISTAAAAAGARQDAYAWLFKTPDKRAQDVRIRVLLEEDAFAQILQDWRAQGYAFGHLVPSLATALGSSGDRPDALAELMGIILNDGVRLPDSDLTRLHFAARTPYETDTAFVPEAPQRVLAPEVAATIRHALLGVVANGTGARARGAFSGPEGGGLVVGGKTGTGDNRFDRFAPGGKLIESRAVDRTATFVFFLGNRFFGTVTAYVRGPESDDYHFTSALAVQVLKSLAPEFQPLVARPMTENTVRPTDG